MLVPLADAITADMLCKSSPPPNPVAVPLLTIVAPEGTVKVSPESPSAKATPVAGEILLVFTSVVAVTVVGKSNVESVKVRPTPEGTVTVSPDVPTSKAVPDCGSSLSTLIVAFHPSIQL